MPRSLSRRTFNALALASAGTLAGGSSGEAASGKIVIALSAYIATLDPTIRALELPSRRKVLLSDTVGFIRSLPTTLVQAFRATLEEVVVTARRREEKVQAVPMAITAFSQADIEQKRILQISDLAKSVPSLSTAQDNSDANGFYSGQIRLRGLPGTEVYFAEVPLGDVDYNPASGITHGTSVGFFYDLDHVEVDKGPQGTLFGKNSIGGLISIAPKRPTNNFEGYAQATFGNYNDRQFEGAVAIFLGGTGGLIEQADNRLAGLVHLIVCFRPIALTRREWDDLLGTVERTRVHDY